MGIVPRGGVVLGFRCVLRGVGRLLRTPSLWPWAVAPVAVTLVIFAVGLWLAFTALHDAVRALVGDSLGDAGAAVVSVLFVLLFAAAALLLLYFLFSMFARIVAAPFLALLSERVVADVSGAPVPVPPGGRFLRWVARPIGEAALLLAIRLCFTVLALPLLLVPVAGGGLFFAALLPLEGMDLMDLAQSARAVPQAERLRFLRRHLAACTGLGLGAALLLLVPVLNLLFLPALVVGAVLLDAELSPDFPSRPVAPREAAA